MIKRALEVKDAYNRTCALFDKDLGIYKLTEDDEKFLISLSTLLDGFHAMTEEFSGST